MSDPLLCQHLKQFFGCEDLALVRLNGYSNENILVELDKGERYVVRLARQNRTHASCLAEEHVLRELKARSTGYPHTPELISMSYFGGRFLHVFRYIEGAIPCSWWQLCSQHQLDRLFLGIAALHRTMALIPSHISPSPSAFSYNLQQEAPSCLLKTEVGVYVKSEWRRFCESAAHLQRDIASYFPWEDAHLQWIHGDIQLENILFAKDDLRAILDFEWVRWDACEKDAIFSAFRIAKEGRDDNVFKYNSLYFHRAIDSYLRMADTATPAFFDLYDELWLPYFCLDQAMIYLQNAFDGIWQLTENIGFLPCFNTVLNYDKKGAFSIKYS